MALAALPVLPLAGCGGDDTGGWVTSLLGAVPDTHATRGYIVVNDESAATRTFDIPVPDDDASNDERADYVMDLLLDADLAVTLSPNPLTGIEPRRPGHARIDFDDVRRDLQAGVGRGAVQVVELDGGDRVTRPDDALEPGADTLADRDDLQALAGDLEDHHVLAGFLSAQLDFGEDGPPGDLDPYQGIAIGGAASDDGDPLLVVALWHADRDDAVHNANALRELAASDERLTGGTWAELIKGEEVDRDGALVTGVFEVDDPRLWSEMISLGTPLLQIDAGAPPSAG